MNTKVKRPWVSFSNMHFYHTWGKQWYLCGSVGAITHPCSNFNGSLSKSKSNFGHHWWITSNPMLMPLTIHTQTSVLVWLTFVGKKKKTWCELGQRSKSTVIRTPVTLIYGVVSPDLTSIAHGFRLHRFLLWLEYRWHPLAYNHGDKTRTLHDTMTTSSNGNIFRVTGHLCGEFTGHRWIPHTKASDAELWYFLSSASE